MALKKRLGTRPKMAGVRYPGVTNPKSATRLEPRKVRGVTRISTPLRKLQRKG